MVTIKIDSHVDQCLKSRKLFVLPVTWGTQHSGTVKKEKKKEKHEGHNTRKPFNLKAVLPLSERVTFYSLKTKEKNQQDRKKPDCIWKEPNRTCVLYSDISIMRS